MDDYLNEKQDKILKFIQSEVSDKGYPPSVREICNAVGLKSTSTVHAHLNKLEKKGYIRRDSTKPRAIEVLSHNEDTVDNTEKFMEEGMTISMIPIVGHVSAGQPVLAVENIEDQFPLPKNFVKDGTYFMLRITGESMIDAGILDSDLVLVKQQQTANNGEIVIALLDDSATCKTFYKEDDRIRLQPENSALSPIYSQDVSILGVVKGVYRTM